MKKTTTGHCAESVRKKKYPLKTATLGVRRGAADNTSSECRNDKNEKVKAAFEVKWLQFISAKLVHLSLNFTPQR